LLFFFASFILTELFFCPLQSHPRPKTQICFHERDLIAGHPPRCNDSHHDVPSRVCCTTCGTPCYRIGKAGRLGGSHRSTCPACSGVQPVSAPAGDGKGREVSVPHTNHKEAQNLSTKPINQSMSQGTLQPMKYCGSAANWAQQAPNKK